MNDHVTLQCPNCQANLRAATRLVGKLCPCPRCSHEVKVRRPLPSDADMTLVPWHDEEAVSA